MASPLANTFSMKYDTDRPNVLNISIFSRLFLA